MRYGLIGALCAGMILALGCGGAERRENPFPTRARLEEIRQQPVPVASFGQAAATVPTWTLTGPLPERYGADPFAPEDALQELAVSKVGAKMSAQSQCVARELGLFYVANDAEPDSSLKKFITASCGSTWGEDAVSHVMTWDDFASFDAAKLVERGGAPLEEMFVKLGANTDQLGMWMTQSKGRIIIMLVGARVGATVAPMATQTPSSGEVVVRGRLTRARGEAIYGRINRGDYETVLCANNSAVSAPDFELVCPVVPSDAMAYLEVMVGKAGRFSARRALSIGFSSARSLSYMPPALRGHLEQVSLPGELNDVTLPQQVLMLVNAARAANKLPALVLSESQTRASMALAGHLFGALRSEAEDDEVVADDILRGLAAGWDVNAPIISGQFTSRFSGHADARELVSGIFDSPVGRAALMVQGEGLLAVGSVIQEGRVGALVNVYERLPEVPYSRRSAQVMKALNASRAAHGVTMAKRIFALNSSAEGISEQLERGELTLKEAADKFSTRAVAMFDQGVQYYWYETDDFERIAFGAPLMSAKRVAVLVAPFKPPGYPRHIYGVVIVMPQ